MLICEVQVNSSQQGCDNFIARGSGDEKNHGDGGTQRYFSFT
jgi:hypothetical protein